MGQNYQKIAEQIDMIGRNVASFYEPVVADMHEVRLRARQFERLTAELKSVSEQSDAQAPSQTLGSITDAASLLRDSIGTARDIVVDVRLHDTLTRMQTHCNRLFRYSKELNSLSFLMLVTTANAAASGFTVEHLVSELREMVNRLNSASSDILGTLSFVDGVRKDTGQALSNAYQLIDDSLETLRIDDPSNAVNEDRRAKAQTPERMADALSASLARLMPGLVACMQHPDAFAQRCDHVASAARMLDDDLNKDTEVALRKLISAQIDDICEELNRTQAEALQTLQSISQKGTDTLESFRRHLENDQRLDQIAAQKDKVAEVRNWLRNINYVSQGALTDLSKCVDQFDGIETIFDHLNAMRAGVRTSSLNADLSERQSKTSMPELRSVTQAVGECAAACGGTIVDLGGLYDKIHTSFGQIDEGAIVEAMNAVTRILSASEAEHDAISEQVIAIRTATTDCTKALHQLTELGNSAHARIASNVMASKQLKQIAKESGFAAEASIMNAENVDIAVVSRVFDSYSIATEREVHNRVLGGLGNEIASVDQDDFLDDDDPLAEFLF